MAFLEELSSIPVLRRAWECVAANRGMPGIDRVSIATFGAEIEQHLARLSDEVRTGRLRPQPVLRIRPAFLRTSDRALVVPTVRDRVVQRAISDLLAPRVEPTLSKACRAFRRGSSAQQAAADVGRWAESGNPWVLRADVKSYFDSIDPEVLEGKLAPFVDAEGLRFLGRILRCRIFDHEHVTEAVRGIAQGSPLSPLLGNLYLSEVDASILAAHPRYLRYCDDLIVLGRDEDEVRKARDGIVGLLVPLSLKLNEEKTRLCRAEDGFVFLGFHFGAAGRGPAVKAVEALGCRLEELASAEELDLGEVDAVFRGWTSYFGEHPECWTSSPVGILALLRGAAQPGDAVLVDRLAEARWAVAAGPSPAVALALAEAWSLAGREDQAWLEVAAAGGGSRAEPPDLERWALLLKVEAEALKPLVRRLVGPAGERLTLLTEGVAELGRYEVASRLAASGTAFAGTGAEAPKAATARDPAAEADLQLLVSWFQGREGAHAVEAIRPSGHRDFLPVQRPLGAEDWAAHLRGERTLALPLVRAGNSSLLGVLDVDVERAVLADNLGSADAHLGRALAAALRLRGEIQRRGGATLLEFSGYKGYHLWMRLEEPVPCHLLRRWLLDVVKGAGPLPEGIRVEEFPNRDRFRPDVLGPVVKLPLGVHGKTGKRCDLLDEKGRSIADPCEAIRATPRFAAERVREVTGAPTSGAEPSSTPPPPAAGAARAPAAGASEPSKPASPEPVNRPGLGPKAQRLLDGCHVLGYLAKRAEATSYLNHRERTSLLCTLGHLGEEGKAALHAIIAHTYNYRREVTERHIGRLPPSPISCPKLRELHPEAAAVGACRCQFQLSGRAYPSPVLLALRASEVPAFRSPPRPARPAASAREEAAIALRREAEEKLRRLSELKRNRRGLEVAIARLASELGALFDRAGGDELELSLGALKRVRQPGGGLEFVIEI